MAEKAKNPKGYGPGSKPLVLRRTDAGIRVLGDIQQNHGIPPKTIQDLVSRDEASLVLTLCTTEGDVQFVMTGFELVSAPGEPERYNFTSPQFRLVADDRQGRS